MEKAYKYRIYPTEEQKLLLSKTFGCTRFIFNHYLAKKIDLYKEQHESLNFYACSKDLTGLKKELEWLREVDKYSLQNSLRDLDKAYQHFFKNYSGFPKFKSKKNHKYSYRTQNNGKTIEYLENQIKLPKLGKVRTRTKLKQEGRILSATITQYPSGQYYVVLTCTDVPITPKPSTGSVIGLDLGIKDFLIDSNGNKIPNLKHLHHSLKKLAKAQRSLSRKSRGGANWNKARIMVARINEHIKNQRYDFLQKLSTKIINENDVICIESLKVKNMVKNHKLARSISDVSWSEFVRQLEYKASWYGKTLVKIDPFYPSSQTCNVCNEKFPITKDLKVRKWTCPNCGTDLDRDTNAAINILNEGLRILFE